MASVGVHLLNLLAIPALAYVIYFRKTQKATTKGSSTPSHQLRGTGLHPVWRHPGKSQILAGSFDLFFVNTLGLPFRIGYHLHGLLIVGLLTQGFDLHQRNRPAGPETLPCAWCSIIIGTPRSRRS